MPTRIDTWKIEEVRRYLAKEFLASHLEDYPRGADSAHLFLVAEPSAPGQRRKVYNLLVTRQFFDRFTDQVALRESLAAADVARQLVRGDGRTVELY